MAQEKQDKVFAKSNEVKVQKVKFTNRYGITLTGDLYLPKNLGKTKSSPQSQSAVLFVQSKNKQVDSTRKLWCKRDLSLQPLTLLIQERVGGNPHNVVSPDINTEYFSAAVDFLSNYTNVDSNKIGILGICGFGGFALNATAMDTRTKAVVTSTMYDMSRVNANGYFHSMDAKVRYKLKESLNNQRTKDLKMALSLNPIGYPKSSQAMNHNL